MNWNCKIKINFDELQSFLKASPIKFNMSTPRIKDQKTSSTVFLLAWIEGTGVLTIELLVAKIIAVYFGTSFFVWTSVIGITLASLTIGYFIGSRLSRSTENLKNMLWILFTLTAIFIACIPFIAQKLLVTFFDLGVMGGAIVSAITLCFPPLLCLGSISPLLIQLNTYSINEAGKIAGYIYAVSTLAGIAACFLLGFWIIPQWGIRIPLFSLFFLIIILMSFLFADKIKLMVNVVLLVTVSFLISSSVYHPNHPNTFGQLLYFSEGILGQLKVKTYSDNSRGVHLKTLTINEIAQTKTVNQPNQIGVSIWRYPHVVSMIASLKKEPGAKALLCGFGGGTLAIELSKLGFKLDIVEIDKRMKEIGINYFNFNDEKANFFFDDARHYIRTTDKKYDLIVIDLLNGEVQPNHLFSTQSFNDLKKLLKPNSIVILNYQSPGDYKNKAFLSIGNTLLKSGFHASYWTQQQSITDDVIYFVSLNEIDFSKISRQKMNICCLQGIPDELINNPETGKIIFDSKGMVLDDDKPILEHLNSETILEWRRGMIKNETQPQLQWGMPLYK